MNNVKTFVLMGALVALFGLAGQLLGGSQGLVFALVVGSLFNFVMYFFSVSADRLGSGEQIAIGARPRRGAGATLLRGPPPVPPPP